MPKKGYKQTKEHAQKGADARKGTHHSDDSKLLMSKLKTEYYKDPILGEVRRKEFHQLTSGENHWNWGKECSVECKEKLSMAFSGENNPNYGVPMTDEQRNKISKARTGYVVTDETKKAISDGLRKVYSDPIKGPEIKERLAKSRAKQGSIERSSIELLIQKELEFYRFKENKDFIVNYPILNYNVDFLIPEFSFVVEVDGDYWHNKPGAKEHDHQRDLKLLSIGYNTVRLTETEIKQNPRSSLVHALSCLCPLLRMEY